MAFCSCKANLIPNNFAAIPPGPQTNPPIPSTKSGCCCFIIFLACKIALNTFKGANNQPKAPLPLKPCMLIEWNGILAFSTHSFSIPVGVPSQQISIFFLVNSSAKAMPGKTCPPVPAAIIMILLIRLTPRIFG